MTERQYRTRKHPATVGFGRLSVEEQREMVGLLQKAGYRLQLTHTTEGNELVFLKVSVSGIGVDVFKALANVGVEIIHSLQE